METTNGDEEEPVSPTGQYFTCPAFSICILAVFESEVPIDDSQAVALLRDLFLPMSPRFSSIMVRDDEGVQRWRPVKVELEEHVFVPTFPPGLTPRCYEERTQSYLSQLSREPLPQNRPLWEAHILKYPTTSAAGTLVIKLHHALGDGFSLMGALFSCLRRADDPSLPLTFPTRSRRPSTKPGGTSAVSVSRLLNTVRDFAWGILKSNLLQDDPSPIRAAVSPEGPRSVIIASVSFPLETIRRIKAKLGGTVNDVIVGIIFYGIDLYVEMKGGGRGLDREMTAMVVLNTRAIFGYRNLKEMSDPTSRSPWGNHFGFLHVPVPKLDSQHSSPLDYVYKTRQLIKRKRNSVAVYLTAKLLDLLRRFRGPEATAEYLRKTLRNTSFTISNLIGPVEQMHIAGHRVRSFYFMVVGGPQSLTISVVSYMGKLKVAFGTEKGVIDSQLLVSCMEMSFAKMTEAARTPLD